jgi:hypothetical protein
MSKQQAITRIIELATWAGYDDIKQFIVKEEIKDLIVEHNITKEELVA